MAATARLSKGNCMLTLSGHTAQINGCAFSPTGNLLITASDDKTVKVWDVQTGREIRTLTGARDGVFGCDFSPDGSMILALIRDESLMRWETFTGEPYETFVGCYRSHATWRSNRKKYGALYPGLGGHILAWAHFPDQVWIVTTGGIMGKQVSIWSAISGDEIFAFTLTGDEGIIQKCAFSPGFQFFGGVRDDHSIRVWDTNNWTEVAMFRGDPEFIHACAFSPDGNKLVSGVQTYPGLVVNIWDIHSHRVVATLEDEAQPFLFACAFSPDGSRVVAACSDDFLRVWDVNAGMIAAIDQSACHLTGCIFSPDNRKIVSTSIDGPNDAKVRFWMLD